MKFLRKKRVFAILLILFLLLLFYQTNMIGRWLYPIHYRAEIAKNAAVYDIDPYLIASIIRVESKYKPNMVSKKGAVGLMQIMPDTADWVVHEARFAPSETMLLHNAAVNIKIGSWYLRSLTKQFQGHFDRVSHTDEIAVIAAAYNAGPGNAKKWLRTGRWEGTSKTIDRIPFGETRHYVHRVLFYYEKYCKYYSSD